MICEREQVPLMLDPAPARELPSSCSSESPGSLQMKQKLVSCVQHVVRSRGNGRGTDAYRRGGVVLKLGSKGAFLETGDGLHESSKPFPVKAIDTTAAGDAFNGAFATGLMMQMSIAKSARFAGRPRLFLSHAPAPSLPCHHFRKYRKCLTGSSKAKGELDTVRAQRLSVKKRRTATAQWCKASMTLVGNEALLYRQVCGHKC